MNQRHFFYFVNFLKRAKIIMTLEFGAACTESSDLQVVCDACNHVHYVTREISILKLGDAAIKGNDEAIDTLENFIQHCSKKQRTYDLQAGLRALGNVAKRSEKACNSLLRLAKHVDFEVRRGVVLALRTQLRSIEIIVALATLQQSGKFVDLDRFQKIIRAAHVAVDGDENHLVRLAALESLTDLVNNLHSDSILCVSKCLSDPEETIKKIAAEMLGDAMLSSREMKSKNAGNIYIEEGFSKLLDAGEQKKHIRKSFDLNVEWHSFHITETTIFRHSQCA